MPLLKNIIYELTINKIWYVCKENSNSFSRIKKENPLDCLTGLIWLTYWRWIIVNDDQNEGFLFFSLCRKKP